MVPFKGMFINPTTTDMRDTPEEVAISMIGTMIHELAHFKERNHGASFASEMQKVMTLLKVYPAIDLDQVEKNLTKHVAKNKDIFDFLNKEFRSGNLKPRGNRFKDAGGYQQIENEGSTESVEGTSGAGEGWRPSLSEISEPGTEGVGELDDSTADDSDAEAAEPALRTQAQVDRHEGESLAHLADIFLSTAAEFDVVLPHIPSPVNSQLVMDAITHEHDLRHAVGRAGGQDSEGIGVALGFLLNTVEEKAPGRAQEFSQLGISRYELLRSLSGRRSIEQMNQLGLDGSQIATLSKGSPMVAPDTAVEI
jgi:hypothetical protein